MKRGLYLLGLIFLCMSIHAQTNLLRQKDKVFNWSVKAGMNTVMPDIDYIQIDGVSVDDIRSVNDVGYYAEILGRVNIHRFFLQSSVSWKYARGKVCFDLIRPPLVGTNDPITEEQSISMKIYSLEIPMAIGYHVVKQNPYVLSVMGGTKLKYNYNTDYTSRQSYITYLETNTPYYVSLFGSFEVVIGKFTFDFGYEYGINKMSSHFEYSNNLLGRAPMKMRERLDGINMSVGILF